MRSSTDADGSLMEQRALASGEWVRVDDPSDAARSCFFHAATGRTTRDLRATLLQDVSATAAAGHRPGAGACASTLRFHDNGSGDGGGEEPSEVQQLQSALAAARALNEQYEHEITQLRHFAFARSHANASSGSGALSPSRLEEPLSAGVTALVAASGSAPGQAAAARVLAERVRALEALNARLLRQAVLDRETRFVCAVCRERTVADDDDAHPRGLALRAAQHVIAGSLAPHTLPTDADTLARALPSDAQLQRGAMPGYLPRTFVPTNVATPLAPLAVASRADAVHRGEYVATTRDCQKAHGLRFDLSPPLPMTPPSRFSRLAPARSTLRGGDAT